MTAEQELSTETTEETATTEAATTAAGKATETTGKAAETIAAGDKTEGDKAAATEKAGKTIATGADTEAEEATEEAKAAADKATKVDRNELNEELRKLIAEHYAAGDKKAEAKELKRLERVKDVKSLWGMYRELEGKFTGGGLVKVPGKDAKPEDIAAYHKAMGVPEKPEDYLKNIKLESGAVIGDADQPIVGTFTEAMHKSGAPPAAVNAAINWYYKNQEEAAAAIDDADDTFRRESERALKDELGPAFKRQMSATSNLFATAPGGTDLKNENSLYARLMGGRMADGRIIGNDPDVMRWLVGIVGEVNPIATVVEDGAGGSKAVETELGEIQNMRKTDPKKYWSDPVQARELELIAALEKNRARA